MAHCNNCWGNPDWCGCDVYREFNGTISLAKAIDIKAKRNKEKGMKNPKEQESY